MKHFPVASEPLYLFGGIRSNNWKFSFLNYELYIIMEIFQELFYRHYFFIYDYDFFLLIVHKGINTS